MCCFHDIRGYQGCARDQGRFDKFSELAQDAWLAHVAYDELVQIVSQFSRDSFAVGQPIAILVDFFLFHKKNTRGKIARIFKYCIVDIDEQESEWVCLKSLQKF